MPASELKSNISNANLDRNKKKLFLYLDTNHANQTIFLHTLLTSKKIYRRLMRRNVVLSAYNRATYCDQTQAIM